MTSRTPPPGSPARTFFKVLDALDHPHGGRILRVRLGKGDAPSVGELKGARLPAEGPDGERATVRVLGFALTGGRVTNRRLAETGRVDLHVEEEEGGPVSLQWRLLLD